jgi:hypothetical protein
MHRDPVTRFDREEVITLGAERIEEITESDVPRRRCL